jgi:hypothetical protein
MVQPNANALLNAFAELGSLRRELSGEIGVGRGDGPRGACLTCSGRRYVDVSTDGGVSFQTPTHISPEQSFSQVRAHEHEHIRRDAAAARTRGDEIVSQNVRFTVAVCGECGKMYKSGGTATTVTRSRAEGGSDGGEDSFETGVDAYI